MKKIDLYMILIIGFNMFSCGSKSTDHTIESKSTDTFYQATDLFVDSISSNKTEIVFKNFSIKDVQGVWGTNLTGNADFVIKGDSSFSVEYPFNKVFVFVRNDTLIFDAKPTPFKERIEKSTKDSLWLYNDGILKKYLKL